MTYESILKDHILTIKEEFETETVELIGEPITRKDGGVVAVYRSLEDDEIFMFCDNPDGNVWARHSKEKVTLYGGGDFRRGILRAINLYISADFSDDDAWLTIPDQIDR